MAKFADCVEPLVLTNVRVVMTPAVVVVGVGATAAGATAAGATSAGAGAGAGVETVAALLLDDADESVWFDAEEEDDSPLD